MSAFLHQIFYANNKFGHDSPEDLSAFVEELSKWSAPLSFYGLPSKVITPRYGVLTVLEKEKPPDFAYENKFSSANPQTPMQVVPPCFGVLTKPKTSRPLFDKPARPVHPRIPSNLSIFQSVFLLHYGYSEYIMAGNRMLNRELEEKQKIMETLSKTPKKLKECNHKLTNDNIQEILSGLLVATKEEIMHLVAYSVYYNRIIYLVFTHSYLVFSPTKETAVDSTNIESVYILNQTRKHPKYGGSYYPDFNPTLEKLENIHNSKIHLEHYAKPFKGVSAYKLPELEEMATKMGVFENGVPVKYKKKELYDKIVEVCCAGICA